MPNWCYTDITLTNRKGLKNLYDKIKEWTSKDYMENSFGTTWLGNIVGFSGICDHPEGGQPRCRGDLIQCDLSKDETEIMLQTETAWSPMLDMWVLVINKHAPGTTILYEVAEPSCDVVETNNPELAGKYYIDSYDADYDIIDESIYDATEETVWEVIRDYAKKYEKEVEGNTISEAIDWFEDNFDGVRFYLWDVETLDTTPAAA